MVAQRLRTPSQCRRHISASKILGIVLQSSQAHVPNYCLSPELKENF